MAIVLSGNPSHITSPLVAQVTTIGNNGSGAIRVYTATPHQFGPGDSVRVYAGSGADGVFTANIITSTQFDLVGSTYVGGSGDGGFAYDQSLTPPILSPTDGDTFSQQLSGALSSIQGIEDRTQYLQQQAFAASQTTPNWHPAFLASAIASGFVFQGACWSPVNGAWGVVGQNVSGNELAAYSSNGVDDGNHYYWTSLPFFSTPVTSFGAAIASDPSGNFWVATLDASSNITVQMAGAGSLARSGANVGGADIQLIVFNGRLIYACGSGEEAVLSSALLSAPTVWTDTFLGLASLPKIILETDGKSVAIACPYNRAIANNPNYYTTPDGVTWTAQSLSTVLTGAAYTVQGMCYAPASATWYMIVSIQGSTIAPSLVYATKTPASPTSWVLLQGSVNNTTVTGAVDLAALNGYLFATQFDQSSGGPSFQAFSPNVGYTWYQAPQTFFTNNSSSGTPYTRSRVVQGDYGLFSFNNLWGRFSLNYGLPSKHL